VFDVYGDSYENLFEILALVMLSAMNVKCYEC